MSINERDEKALAHGQRGEGCATAAVAELKATGSQSITVLLPGIRLYQLCNAVTPIIEAVHSGLLQRVSPPPRKKFDEREWNSSRVWEKKGGDESLFSLKIYPPLEFLTNLQQLFGKNKGDEIFFYKKVYFPYCMGNCTMILFSWGRRNLDLSISCMEFLACYKSFLYSDYLLLTFFSIFLQEYLYFYTLIFCECQ